MPSGHFSGAVKVQKAPVSEIAMRRTRLICITGVPSSELVGV